MTLLRRLRYLAMGLLLLALALVALWPESRPVDTAGVDRGPVRATLEAEGRTRVRDRYVVTAPASATARRLALAPGDRVQAGQALVVLEAGPAGPLDARSRAALEAWTAGTRASLASAREEAAAAEAAARQAASEAARLQLLARDRLVAAESAERAATLRQRAEREAASARFREATARHQMEAAQAMLARGLRGDDTVELVVAAPVAGVLLRRHFESARPVQAGEALLELGDPEALEVEVDVLSSDAVRLRDGMPVELLRWGGTDVLRGRVRRVEPGGFSKVSALGVEEQRVRVIVDLDGDPATWQHLGDAYRVDARFVLDAREDVARVPGSAVFRHGDGHAVFRLDGRRARLAPVRIGLSGEGLTEIVEGLADSDRVVVHPDRELADGARIRPR